MAHNASFDVSFIEAQLSNDREFPADFTCDGYGGSGQMLLLPQLNRYKLDTVAKALNVSLENHHRAVDDAGCYCGDFCKICRDVKRTGMISTWMQLNALGTVISEEQVEKTAYLSCHHSGEKRCGQGKSVPSDYPCPT